MSTVIATTPLKTLFKFPFQGPNWRSQFIIGSALVFAGSFVPIVPVIFAYGYALQIMRQAIEGKELSLPDWNDWGKLGMDGLRGTLVSLVYLLPGILVYVGGTTLYFAGTMAFPMMMSAARESGGRAMGVTAGLGFFAIMMALFFLSLAVSSVLYLLGGIPLPVATAHFVAQDKVSAAFRVREWWPFLRVNQLGYFAAWVVLAGLVAIWYVVFMIAYYSVVLCCFVPVLAAPIGFYMLLVSAALFGQIYRESAILLSASS